MRIFLALSLLLLAALMKPPPARAADLGLASEGCDCGTAGMVTIYDYDPGVVKRHWASGCDCRHGPAPQRFGVGYDRLFAGEPFAAPFMDPWRR